MLLRRRADSDVVFANSTCFTPLLCDLFEDKVNLLKAGSVVVMTTKRLSHTKCPGFETLDVSNLKEDWGSATVYIHRKLEDGSVCPRGGYTVAEEEKFAKEEKLAAAKVEAGEDVSGFDPEEDDCVLGDHRGSAHGYWGMGRGTGLEEETRSSLVEV